MRASYCAAVLAAWANWQMPGQYGRGVATQHFPELLRRLSVLLEPFKGPLAKFLPVPALVEAGIAVDGTFEGTSSSVSDSRNRSSSSGRADKTRALLYSSSPSSSPSSSSSDSEVYVDIGVTELTATASLSLSELSVVLQMLPHLERLVIGLVPSTQRAAAAAASSSSPSSVAAKADKTAMVNGKEV